jgi:N-acetylmuramoyl-L-alanine amidase
VVSVIASKINALFGSLVLLGAIICASGANAAEIAGVRLGQTSATETRIVFDSKGLPDYALGAEATGDGRLLVTFKASRRGPSFPSSVRPLGHVGGVSAGDAPGGEVVVRIDFRASAKIKEIIVLPPTKANPLHRLVFDLVSARPTELLASLPERKFDTIVEVIQSVAPPQPAPGAVVATAPPAVESPAPAVRLPVIIVDAGHGGGDPGAAGEAGSAESAATLASALALAELLRETGRYEVVLTRSKDVRLAHEERSRIARDAKADLFISLHADAHADPKVRGGSVYTLSDEGSERSAREALAQGDYHVFDLDIGEADPQVGGILYNLAQRKTSNESDKFAALLIAKLSGLTPLLNNTHRRGNFRVLLAPDVPAVLLELAFISNKHDEANLKSPAWRKRTMTGVASAIDAYFLQRAAAKHASNAAAAPR